jgi:hypothetical protein
MNYEIKSAAQFKAEIEEALQRVRRADFAARMNDLECMFQLSVLSLKMDRHYTSMGWSDGHF